MTDISGLTSESGYPRSSGEAQDNGSPSRRHAASAGSLPVRSMLNFGVCHGVDVQPNGLCLPDGLPFGSWRELGGQVNLAANCSAWWLGDWLVYGEQNYSDRYKQAIIDTSLDYQTLRNYAWVAKKFPMSRRRDTLSFGHHVEVCALPADEQDAWLTQAEQLNWSRNQLRRGLRTNRQAARGRRSPSTRSLKIDVPTERHDRWQSAAEQRKWSVADWIIATLDRAASEELGSQSTR